MSEYSYSPSLYHRYLMDRTVQTLAFDRADDPEKWKIRLRQKLIDLTGYDGRSERVPLDVRSLWKRKHEYGTVEKIVFAGEPHADIPAYVCIPEEAEPPYVFFICLQGHSTGMHLEIAVDFDDESRSIKVEGDKDRAVSCMKRGIAALCIEQRSFGERSETVQKRRSDSKCHDATMQALMLGKTLVGERVFDVDRGIDYLMSRGDVDGNCIGVTGNSGGGTASVYAAALLDRVSFAMPSCSFGTYRDSKMVLCHCGCGYIPRIMQYAEMHDVLGLFAPRPVVIVAGREDPIVPLDSVERGFEKLKEIYRAFGAADRCHLVVGEGGHRFYADPAWKVMSREIGAYPLNSKHSEQS